MLSSHNLPPLHSVINDQVVMIMGRKYKVPMTRREQLVLVYCNITSTLNTSNTTILEISQILLSDHENAIVNISI